MADFFVESQIVEKNVVNILTHGGICEQAREFPHHRRLIVSRVLQAFKKVKVLSFGAMSKRHINNLFGHVSCSVCTKAPALDKLSKRHVILSLWPLRAELEGL